MFPQRNFQIAKMFPQRNFQTSKIFPQRKFLSSLYSLKPFIAQNGKFLSHTIARYSIYFLATNDIDLAIAHHLTHFRFNLLL